MKIIIVDTVLNEEFLEDLDKLPSVGSQFLIAAENGGRARRVIGYVLDTSPNKVLLGPHEKIKTRK